jgi:ATP-binding cassette subfamily C protein
VRRQRDYVLTEEAVAADGTEVMTALRDITAVGGESRVYARSAHRVNAQVLAARGTARMTAARSLAVAVGGMLPIPLVLAAVPWLLRDGASAGQVVGALAYLAGGLQPALNTLVQGLGSSGVRMAVTLDRILEQAELPPRRVPAAARRSGRREETGALRMGNGTCDLELRGLTFGYGQRAIPVISNLSLKIPDGDHVAIVGPSGVGKSTLAGLISGTLAPTAGEVRIGGIPVRDLGPAELASLRVLIPQEAYVFAGSLAENLIYLNPRMDPDRVRKTASAMGLDPLVKRLGGYRKPLDPAALSAGERQLIALTRAYLSPARLVLLDEATCHLDAAAEANAEQMFARRPGALLIIAHRMSSALRAKRVLVLDGDRADIGTHDSMLRRSPLFRELAGYWERMDKSQPAPSAIRMASTLVRPPVFPIAREM